jgi:hypothetical protein
MTARLEAGKGSSQQVVADARRLTAGYRSLEPVASRFGPADYALNRQVAQQSFAWLSRARVLYGGDPLVNAELMRAYGSIGGFYHDYGAFYPAGAFIAYGGAARLARLLVLGAGNSRQIESELERYSLAYAMSAYAYGSMFDWWVQPTGVREPPQVTPGRAPTTLKPVEMPSVDASTLNAEEREAWEDVRNRFRTTAAKVHEARILMEDLSARLARRQLTPNLQDAATASKMQGFLEDAVELIGTHRFEMARTALVRADYERGKLKGVTGQ